VVISGSGDQTLRVWDLASGTLVRRPFTGHGGPVTAVTVAELDGRAVVISGSGDQTLRVWDLANGSPLGRPVTGHTDWVRSVAVTKLDGRPVVISGGDDQTVRVWDLASGSPLSDPFTGHDGPVTAVTAAELDGRPVVISGGDDQTVRVWDLASGTPLSDPFTSNSEAMVPLAPKTVYDSMRVGASVQICAGISNSVGISSITALGGDAWQCERIAAVELGSKVHALTWVSRGILAAATELGIVVLQFSIGSSPGAKHSLS